MRYSSQPNHLSASQPHHLQASLPNHQQAIQPHHLQASLPNHLPATQHHLLSCHVKKLQEESSENEEPVKIQHIQNQIDDLQKKQKKNPCKKKEKESNQHVSF